MPDSLPLVVTLLYITAGYMLMVGFAATAVAGIARLLGNRYLYGVLAITSFAGASGQIAAIYYYQSTTVEGAVHALGWHVNFISIAVLASCLYISLACGGIRSAKRLLIAGGFWTALIVVLNRTSIWSLHFSQVSGLKPFTTAGHEGLVYLQGSPGSVTAAWYLILLVALVLTLITVYSYWRRKRPYWIVVVFVYLVVQVLCLGASWLIDRGTWQLVYPMGFAICGAVLMTATSVTIDAARRSQKLSHRERQMQTEILHRRKAEDKLQRLSQVFMQAPAPTHIVEISGKTLQVNKESVRYLQRDVSLTPKVNFLTVLESLEIDKAQLLEDLAQGKVREFGPFHFAAGVPVSSLHVMRDAWLMFKAYPIVDLDRQLHEFVVRLEDVTERQFVDNAIKTISLAASAETGQAFFTNLVVQLARLLGKQYVFIGLKKTFDGVAHVESIATAVDGELTNNFCIRLHETPSELALKMGAFAVECEVQKKFPKQGLLRDLGVQSYIGAAITDEAKNPIGVLAVMDIKPMEHVKQVQDVVNIFVSRAGNELQRLEAEQTIRKMAYEDYLTGLPNRTQLNEYVVDLLQNNQKGVTSAFIQLDLDHFKTINDALGHDVGDDVIRCLGTRLAEYADDTMLVARIGGDEFAIVVSDLGDSVSTCLERIAQDLIDLMERPVQVGDHLLDVGCTMGVVLFPDFAHTAIDVFRSADTALNKAKNTGARGGYQMFTPEMRDSVSKRLQIEKGLRNAMQQDELALFYQPQVDASGRLTGAEALIRWLHPKQGLIPPISFIPVAEETGLINLIGQWVLSQALTSRKRWTEGKVPFVGYLSVNVSAWQFARPDFVKNTIEAIQKAAIPPKQVTLEVTETALLSDIAETIDKLTELREFGVTIALDDFGTGYSSLAYLRDLPLDIIKIDKAFVDALATQAQEPLVESMIAIGKHMGLQVVAEGVETQLQFERLTALGCNVFQGYLFSKPMPEDEFVKWIQRRAQTL